MKRMNETKLTKRFLFVWILGGAAGGNHLILIASLLYVAKKNTNHYQHWFFPILENTRSWIPGRIALVRKAKWLGF